MKRYPLVLACAAITAGGVPALASGASPRPGDATVDAGYSLAFDGPASGVLRVRRSRSEAHESHCAIACTIPARGGVKTSIAVQPCGPA
jgi:hypothetical protein